MKFQAKWIGNMKEMGDVCPVFRKEIKIVKPVLDARLFISALGVYEAKLNEKRIGEFVLAPGWTAYEKRVQYQEYDIVELLQEENIIEVYLGKGWYSSQMPGWKETDDKRRRAKRKNAIIAEIHVQYTDGDSEIIMTDQSWLCGESPIRFSELYDGEHFDASGIIENWCHAAEIECDKSVLIPQEGEEIHELERVSARRIFVTPQNELVVDFGQEITGYVEFTVTARSGEIVRILHGEVLDKDGNFYNENYRSAKAEIKYVCKEGKQTWHPHLTYFGFRYIKLDQFPEKAEASQFCAIVVHSEIKRTGYVSCGNEDVNQLFSNIIWGQRGNFLDIPTDCPQRDERLGWTGDAQVFVKSASYNFDVERFFTKWLHDLKADQREDGSVGQVIPDYLPEDKESAAWGDAATICPWQIYLTYGNKDVLEDQYDSMKKWVDYISQETTRKFLWTGGMHFGDWLGLDAEPGSYKGKSREDFIATAFYAYSTELLIKAGKVLGNDMTDYEDLYVKIIDAFRKEFPVYKTQTECVLAAHFRLAENVQEAADTLAAMIRNNGEKIATGFVGTPYILHVLSKYGYNELAYTLFLREKYPSWLFSVKQGATTVWEHWDGIMENGEFWSSDMNSFNHYAYGAVADWIYEKAAGICVLETNPGFQKVKIEPMPDRRLKWLDVSIETRCGKITSKWNYCGENIRYEIVSPVPADIIIEGETHTVSPGRYIYWSNIKEITQNLSTSRSL